MIPGLEKIEFARFGQMHRNTFIFSPSLLSPTLQFRFREDLFFAGKITGVEGYASNTATDIIAGINAVKYLNGTPLIEIPQKTMIGALGQYVSHAEVNDFRPMKANLGVLPTLSVEIKGKRMCAITYAERSESNMKASIRN